jgi:hypothetical protein
MLPPLRYSDVLFSKSYLITPLIDLGFRSEAACASSRDFSNLPHSQKAERIA